MTAIFPKDPFLLGRLAEAHLLGVETSPLTGSIARYGLSPLEGSREWVERTAFVAPMLGLRYAPLPGLWVTMRRASVRESLDSLEPDAGHELLVGAEAAWIRAQLDAIGGLGVACPVLVPPYTIRALALGYMYRVGFAAG